MITSKRACTELGWVSIEHDAIYIEENKRRKIKEEKCSIMWRQQQVLSRAAADVRLIDCRPMVVALHPCSFCVVPS